MFLNITHIFINTVHGRQLVFYDNSKIRHFLVFERYFNPHTAVLSPCYLYLARVTDLIGIMAVLCNKPIAINN
jgi:hypothetical protein